MQVIKEQIDPCTVALDIRIEPETVSRAFGQAYREFGQFTNVPGFRPGKAPRKMVERYVNQERLRERVREIVAVPAYREAIEQEQITPSTDPEVEFSDLADGQPWQFKAIVPTPPRVTLGEYEDIVVERPIYPVADKDVDEQIEALRAEHARLVAVDDRGVQPGDAVIADMAVAMDGDDSPASPRRVLIRAGDNIPGFDDAILGQGTGEERTFDLTYPEDYQDAERAGKNAAFTFKVASINQRVLPEVTDEWVAGVTAFQTVQELRDAIRNRREEQSRTLSDRIAEARIVEELVRRSTIEYPNVMVQKEMQDEAHDLSHELSDRKMSYEEYLQAIGQTEEQHQEKLQEDATNRLKNVLVLRELARKLDVHASGEELATEMARIAVENALSEEEARKLVRDERRRSQVANRIVQSKLREHLLNSVTANDVPVKSE
jgi:trigger factor